MRFVEVRLHTHDVDALGAFYGQRLGLAVDTPARGGLHVAVGESRLVFERAAEPAAPYHLAFNVPESSFADAKTWLAGRCALVTDAAGTDTFFFEGWNAHAVYFADPGGNILELIARHTVPSSRSTVFGPHDLERISEVGIVSEDPRRTAGLACRRLDATVYRGGLNDAFVPVGDEFGLLIIVARGRAWYPELTLAAEPGPVALRVAGAPTFDLTPQARIIGA